MNMKLVIERHLRLKRDIALLLGFYGISKIFRTWPVSRDQFPHKREAEPGKLWEAEETLMPD